MVAEFRKLCAEVAKEIRDSASQTQAAQEANAPPAQPEPSFEKRMLAELQSLAERMTRLEAQLKEPEKENAKSRKSLLSRLFDHA